jgi:RNA polymerase sigma factor (sigma-70 family)
MPALMAETRAEPDTPALVARARGGDRAAFAALIEAHYDFIFRTAWKWSGNRVDAEDVAQEVCVKLATAIDGFDGRSAFSSWVYRITLNAVRDLQRAGARQARRGAEFAEVSADSAPAAQEETVAENQIWAAVRGLPPKQRDAVLLVYAEELSHAAAAAVMGVRESTVSWYVHEARKALKDLL